MTRKFSSKSNKTLAILTFLLLGRETLIAAHNGTRSSVTLPPTVSFPSPFLLTLWINTEFACFTAKSWCLHLDRNRLTGSIPESFGAFQGNVPGLYLSHNQLSGKIPASLGNLDFGAIDFSRNKLEGDASILFGPNKTTQIVDLSRNLLEFDLSKVAFQSSLTSLDINHNKIYGSIPQRMTQLDLQFLNVSYNRLCGKIPVGGKLQSFDYSTYFHNRCLCGAPLESCKKA
ncbi:hypothetical protein GH714_032045 [Hevea brasiliensis]|uniref:Leucine-rich repeat-containing N-terminal plant-type domain-containing protein n=1 Tax=Hevea brasiliensis TaxID=3981 RepID=A0A6A6M2C2_HEVBR|nr:hypothetical protein GH714_032045 [Hevea brasiliensis]